MFSEILEQTVSSVKGARAAILMGFDGIAVETYAADGDADIESVGMEFSVLLKDVRNAAQQLEAGEANEMVILTDRFTTILRTINEDYFLALTVDNRGNVGKARYLLRMSVPKLQELL